MVELRGAACYYRTTVTFKTSHQAPWVLVVKHLLLQLTALRPALLVFSSALKSSQVLQEAAGFSIKQEATGVRVFLTACCTRLHPEHAGYTSQLKAGGLFTV